MRLLATTLTLGALAMPAPAVEPPRSSCVVLSWRNAGDYGPATPGTRTAGWQEAIDACARDRRDLYVEGGWGGRDAIYHVAETITVPPSQDFRIDGGVYVLNWVGPADRDLLRLDSGMDCHFTFGIMVYGGQQAALRVRPENPVPIDGFPAFVDCEVRASSIADPHPFTRGRRAGGAGVVFDTERAAITHADFAFTAVLNFATCIVTPDSGHAFALNQVACGHLHTNADSSALIAIGGRSEGNVFALRVGVDQGAAGVEGLVVRGTNNRIEVGTRGGFAPGRDIVLGESAAGNVVAVRTAGVAKDAWDLVTDRARTPTNEVTWAGPPAPIRTLRLTPDATGVAAYVQRLYPAALAIEPAGLPDVVAVTLWRGDARVERDPRFELTLSPGDRLEVRAHGAVTVQMVPVARR